MVQKLGLGSERGKTSSGKKKYTYGSIASTISSKSQEELLPNRFFNREVTCGSIPVFSLLYFFKTFHHVVVLFLRLFMTSENVRNFMYLY